MSTEVGDGNSTLFWRDRWLMGYRLSILLRIFLPYLWEVISEYMMIMLGNEIRILEMAGAKGLFHLYIMQSKWYTSFATLTANLPTSLVAV
ncbi:hypothetical protein ACJX0J_019366, partial [Zea mays]